MEKKFDDMTYDEKLSADLPYYLKCTRWDLISRLQPFFQSGLLRLRTDGKIDYERKPIPDPPWCYVQSMGKNCFITHRIFTPTEKLIHSECQSCWKVVVAPRTLEELFALYKLQLTMNVPCKCGVELRRPNSNKPYGGYFYTNSLEEGLVRYRDVRRAVSEEINPDVPVILKRACTEYEQDFGPSDKWTVTPEQLDIETVYRDSFVWDIVEHAQSPHQVAHVHIDWIQTAYQWGDDTYLLYTGGNKLFPDLLTYHDQETQNG